MIRSLSLCVGSRSIVLGLAVLSAAASTTRATFTTFEAAGSDAASITATRDAFARIRATSADRCA